MSTAVFPSFVGLKWGVKKTPQWETAFQKARSGFELRAQFMSYPIYKISLSYEVLRANAAYAELQQLMGFFNARGGAFDTFYYSDPDDNTATDVSIGPAVSGQLTYTALKSYGNFIEPIGAFNGNPTNVKVNGVTKTLGADYTVSSNKITFTSQPTAGHSITWSGAHYHNVRFDKDAAEFEQFMKDLWQLQRCDLITVKVK